MIIFFKYVAVRTHDQHSASARYIINTLKISLYLFCFYYFRMKLCQNVEKTAAIHLRNIQQRNIAKFFVVSHIFILRKRN